MLSIDSGMSLCSGVVELPNRNPFLLKAVAMWYAIFLSFEVAFALSTYAATANISPGIFGGSSQLSLYLGLTLVWTVLTVLGLPLLYRGYRRATPDFIRIEPDRLVGMYGKHLIGPNEGTERTIPFSAIAALNDAGWRNLGSSGYFEPADVIRDRPSAEGFDPKSVRDLVRGPQLPRDQARGFHLTKQNLTSVRHAVDAWRSSRTAVPGASGPTSGNDLS